MLILNLLPPEMREIEICLPITVDQHPFFSSILSISGLGGNPIVGKITGSDVASQAAFLTSAAQAYAAYSIAAPLSFRRVAELSLSIETRTIAENIFDIEMGRCPLVGAPGTSHLEQFFRLVESLLPGLELPRPDADDFVVHRRLSLNQSGLTDALALCEEIELSGRGVVCAWQDLVSQWQVFLGIRTEKLSRAFLDEHLLVEGGTGKHQHLASLEKMMIPYAKLRASEEYRQARAKMRGEFCRHFDEATREILARLENQPSIEARIMPLN